MKEIFEALFSDSSKMAVLTENMKKFEEEQQLRLGAIQAADLDVLAVCKKHFPNGNKLDAQEMLATAISYFDIEDPKNGGQLYLDWTVEAFIGKKLALNVDDLVKIHTILVELGHDEGNRYEWNDMDNHLFYIPAGPTKKIWCTTNQNRNYMFILDWNEHLGVTDIHVRRYWDQLPESRDKWDEEKREEYLEKGMPFAIKQADWLCERYSDNLLNNQYIDRPDLNWFKEQNFKPKYGDARDAGYVMSMNLSLLSSSREPRVDNAIYHMIDIHGAFFDIRSAIAVLTVEYEQMKPKEPKEPKEPDIGTRVVWNDDNNFCYGEIESIIPGRGNCATHSGNLYVCRFSFDAESVEEYEEIRHDMETYTRNFDDYSFQNGELKVL